jgi:hypothetical protein
MANLALLICRRYAVSSTGDLLPTDGELFKLQVKESKHIGRLNYLQLRAFGNARPIFISSCFEARTAGGLFNIEIARKRYEATRTDDGGIMIAPLKYRSTEGTKSSNTATHQKRHADNQRRPQ